MIIASAIFYLTTAILQCSKNISASMFMSGFQNWDVELFKEGLKYIGSTLDIFSVLAAALGLLLMPKYCFDKKRKVKREEFINAE